VIEVSSYVAAPLAGMTLAQLGAEVVRLDPIGGAADTGRWPLAPSGVSLFWAGLNQGKQSVMADLRSSAGRQVIYDLIASSPPQSAVLLTNAVGQDWLSYDAVRSYAPDVIHVQVLGTPDGSAAIDYTVNAALGFPLVTGPVGFPDPVNHVLPAWDLVCGTHAALAVAAAARHRDRTGLGQQVTVALSDVALAMTGHLGYLAEAQVNGVERERYGNYVYGTFGRDFTCRDGRIMVVALTPRHWSDLLTATDTTEQVAKLAELLQADFTDESERFRHREALCRLLEPWFAQRTVEQIGADLSATSVVWAQYRNFMEVVTDLASGNQAALVDTIRQPGVGEYLAPGSPLWVDGSRAAAQPAPVLGEHTRDVLRTWLGLTEPAIDELVAGGAVAQRVAR
jgi:2-methylfumaryl-CoA isomerase